MEGFLKISRRQAVFQVGELGEIAAARRAGVDLARQLGFDETRAGKLALIITEAATNVVKHAVRGEIMLRTISENADYGIEVIAVDSGPGIENLKSSMQDGVSTTGTYGVGLGAISRLADEFDLYSVPGSGTVLWMQLWAVTSTKLQSEWDIGVVCLPIASEEESGDDWASVSMTNSLTVMVADGLGHGSEAARASRAAVDVLLQSADAYPASILSQAHDALAGTRGAAVAIAQISNAGEHLRYCGVGNIEACIMDGDVSRHMVSHNGIVGNNIRKLQEFTFPWMPESILIMHSDGLGTRWNVANYPGLYTRHPAVIAAILYRDFVRRRDDVTVLVVRKARAR
ncbi:ATP-binding protein [Herbaspirillum sp. GCM10030257]|uniref:ATP-binding protein n=1 Tax=Herbaspirillum sp. GCM10030257 TaxID=3273393 RepID=UPI0036162E2F